MRKLFQRTAIKVGIGVVLVGVLGWVVTTRLLPRNGQAEVVRVSRGEIREVVSETGKISSAKTLALAFDTQGKIASFFVKEGEVVGAGTALAMLDQGELLKEKDREEAAVELSKTNLKNSEGSLKNITEKARVDLENQYASTFSSILSSLTKADAALRNEKSMSDKYFLGVADQTALKIRESYDLANQSLLKTGQDIETMRKENTPEAIEAALLSIRESLVKISSSLDTLSTALSDPVYKVTSTDRDAIDSQRNAISQEITNLTSASNSLSSLTIGNQIKIDDANATIKVYQATLRETEAALALTLERLTKTRLVSPISGTVTKIDAEVGEVANSGKPIISMRGLEPFEIEVEIPETDISRVKIGAPVSIAIEAVNKEKKFKGNVVKIDPQEINREGDIYYKATVALGEKISGLRPSMTADLEIEVSRVSDALLVPRRALIRNADGVFLRVKIETGEERRRVSLGIEDSRNAQILEGLSEGEEVIIQRKTSP